MRSLSSGLIFAFALLSGSFVGPTSEGMSSPLGPQYQVLGVVSSGPSGGPVPGAVVRAWDNALEGSGRFLQRHEPGAMTVSDAHGRFTLNIAHGGDYIIVASHREQGTSGTLVVVKTESEKCEIRLDGAVEVGGVVTNADGVELRGATVVAVQVVQWTQMSSRPDAVLCMTTSDDKGRFRFPGIAKSALASLSLTAWSETSGYGVDIVDTADPLDNNVVVEKGRTVGCRFVTTEEESLYGGQATLWIENPYFYMTMGAWKCVTGRGPEIEVPGVPVGHALLYVRAENCAAKTVEIRQDERTAVIRVSHPKR